MAVAAAELATIPLFASLTEPELEQVAGWLEPRTAPEGVTLAGEGATGYCFFVLADGHAAVSSNGSQLGTLGPGDFFGGDRDPWRRPAQRNRHDDEPGPAVRHARK